MLKGCAEMLHSLVLHVCYLQNFCFPLLAKTVTTASAHSLFVSVVQEEINLAVISLISVV